MKVVPYIGTWIETKDDEEEVLEPSVVPYIGTWIETMLAAGYDGAAASYLI